MNDSQLVTKVEQSASQSLTFLQKHERILLVALALGVASWTGNHWINVSAESAKVQYAIASEELKAQHSKDAQLAQQVQQSQKEYQALVVTLEAQNQQLAAAISTRTVVLAQQQAADRTAPLPELATRWTNLADLQTGDLTAQPDGIKVSTAAARATVAELEEVPVLRADLRDTQTQVKNGQNELGKANVLIVDQGKEIDGLKLEITDQKKVGDAKVAEVKAADRKSKRNWFVRGAITGGALVGYVLIHFM